MACLLLGCVVQRLKDTWTSLYFHASAPKIQPHTAVIFIYPVLEFRGLLYVQHWETLGEDDCEAELDKEHTQRKRAHEAGKAEVRLGGQGSWRRQEGHNGG